MLKALPVSFLKLAELTARRGVNSLSAWLQLEHPLPVTLVVPLPGMDHISMGTKVPMAQFLIKNGMTAAHRSLPFGTKLLVMNRRTGDSCVVKVNDRGPFIGGRVIDLSKGAARQLNMLGSGIAMVDCIVLGK